MGCVAQSGNKVWSLYGAPWLQPVATGRKSHHSTNGPNKPNPLSCVAASCGFKRTVRRGSAVRVRQRALQSPCKSAPFLPAPLAELPTCARYGAVYGASRFRRASSKSRIDAFRIRGAASSATWACSAAGRRRNEERERALQPRAAAGAGRRAWPRLAHRGEHAEEREALPAGRHRG
jgi:hypothetical protein